MSLGVRTNAIYQEVVAAALDLEIDLLLRGGERLVDRKIARTFGGDTVVVRELQRLRELNRAPEHYDLGAYHNALLYAVLPDQIDAMNDAHAGEELMAFCSGRYRVRCIDDGAFEDAFFADTDFALSRDVVNAFEPAEKHVLGLADGVFGVANALPPHAKELRVRRGDPEAVEPIAELTEAHEAALRRRHETAPAAVWRELDAMGWLYKRGAEFPYWPAWLVADGGPEA